MRTLRPLHDRIIVKVVEASDETASGIKLAGGAVEQPPEAVIVSMGPAAFDDIKCVVVPFYEGSHILYVKYAGVEVTMDGEHVLILQPKDILAVIEETIPAGQHSEVFVADILARTPAHEWQENEIGPPPAEGFVKIGDPAYASPFVR